MRNAMINAGIDPPEGELIDDGKHHRWKGAGDKTAKNWYRLSSDGDWRWGAFGRWVGQDMGKIPWSSKSEFSMSDDEKKAWKRRQAEINRKLEEQKKLENAECAAWCEQQWSKAPDATDEHPYLVRKQAKAYGLKLIGDSLMVPIRGFDGLWRGMQFIAPDGSKKFKTGSANIGGMHLIGKPKDRTIIICEGYVTGASIHEATGHAVLVAFVAGNLKTVAETVRGKKHDWTIILAADNDAWAKIRNDAGEVVEYRPTPCDIEGESKKRINTGVTEAEKAVKSVNTATGPAIVRIPQFKDVSTHPTDFNDLRCLEGLEEIPFIIFPPPVAPYNAGLIPESADKPADEVAWYSNNVFNGAPFKLLGYNHNIYYYLGDGAGQVCALKAGEHTDSNMFTLAPQQWWEGAFPGRLSFNVSAAKNAMIQQSHEIGVYDEDRVRGLGAWEDTYFDSAGKALTHARSVLHLGQMLVVDNKRVPLSKFKSNYVYERAASIADEQADPLSVSDANKFLQLCNMLSWEKSINGRLLAGWCIAAIICGALRWRPHIWLTGPSGSGKSWIIHNIIKFATGRHLKGMLGSTSEPGLRGALKNDAFSVFFDEFEAEDRTAAARIQSILEYARPASCNEDSKIYKAKSGGGGVNSYQPRSCIGVASVNVSMTQKADQSRVTVLSLDNGSQEHFNEVIMPFFAEHFTPEYAKRFRARCIAMIPVINQNVDPFQCAVTKKMGSRRQGDQYGTLLACANSLRSNGVATLEQAMEFVGEQDWDTHAIGADQDDECRCLRTILEYVVRIDSSTEMNISEMILTAADTCASPERRKDMCDRLKRIGIRVDARKDIYQVCNEHTAISKIFEKTPWAGGWHRLLKRNKGGQDQVAWFEASVRVVALPISALRQVEPEEQDKGDIFI